MRSTQFEGTVSEVALSAAIAAQLRAERVEARMPFETLEVLAEISADDLRAFEDGRREPSLEQLQQIAAVHGFKLSAFLEMCEERCLEGSTISQ